MPTPFPEALVAGSGQVNSGTVAVQYPAVVGAAWELLAITVKVLSQTSGYFGTVQVNGTAWGIVTTPATTFAADEFSWEGSFLELPNTALTIALSAPAINATTLLASARLR